MVKKRGDDDSENIDELRKEWEVPSAQGASESQASYRVYSTGFLMLDCAIGERDPIKGNLGIPERTIVEGFGRNQSLKTSLYEHLAKNILLDDPENRVIILYAEESDLDRWESIGVTPEMKERITVLGCSEGEDVILHLAEKNLDRIKLAVRDPRVKLVVIDSIKGLCMAKQLYGKKGEITSLEDNEQLALRAKLIGEFIRDFKQLNKRAILYMTNQVGDRLQLSPMDLIVNPQFTVQTPGGRAKEFECQLRIQNETRPIYSEKEHPLTGKRILRGWELSSRLVKNKFCRSSGNRVATANFYFNPPGFSKVESLINIAEYLTKLNVMPETVQVKKAHGGNWTIGSHKCKTREVKPFLLENQDIALSIEKEIYNHADDLYSILEDESDDDIL